MNLIHGKDLASQIYLRLETELKSLSVQPKLHVILATNDSSAHTYVKMKQKQADALGVSVEVHTYPETATAELIISEIQSFIVTEPHAGVLVQLPLYPGLHESRLQIIDAIPAKNDPDGLTPHNLGMVAKYGHRLWHNLSINQSIEQTFMPATVVAIMECLEHTKVDLKGKNICIVNASSLIGKPLGLLLTSMNATVTVCHEHTTNLAEHTSRADILVTATGTPGLITHEMVKQDAIVIDVTSMSTDEGVKGDVLVTPELEAKVSWLTPVPGGVGPLTIACLLRNVVYMNLPR